MPEYDSAAWRVSLHGGHSGQFCDHATGSLREMLESAVARGFKTYGTSEHAPRIEARFLYANERELGWTVEKLADDFETYAAESAALAAEFADRLTVLRGFEIEVVPADRYVDVMREYRTRHSFDYIVGSVHYVDEVSIDGTFEEFEEALAAAGGLEPLAVRYYDRVAEMVGALRPEVVGHLDVIRKNGHRYGALDTPAIRAAAERALEVIRRHDAILDLNTAGYRKGLGTPYPDAWLVRAAHRMDVAFCLGDDAHGPEDVGAGFDEAREYLVRNGVHAVTVLHRNEHGIMRQRAPLA